MKKKKGLFDRKKAAALGYDQDSDRAPRLLAKGSGIIADKIIERAKEHNIDIKEDRDLVEVLSTLDIYEEIPENLYRVVAELLAEIYRINNKV
ncbi:EscU/YscU/HrcU family type III secretion system export apparatus switch protein [Limisalsivibrio acetivorans]|uniref:EscU/YscU/HrcU family type III secretion system export apparatus switch protein n=1 Tax=Limisalsivibrio acetivorans TaxID=1304888 RepID=UPI0003B6F595|nr:EscU/YscU/HrcU family type III secretion system export apparatus switch protein [Limisalsivibrio acetivorans]